MDTKVYDFKLNGRTIKLNVPCVKSVICTNKFCPQPLLIGEQNIVCAINGESEDDFLTDCKKQIMGMEVSSSGESLLGTHIAGLMAVVMDHLSRCGRLIFGDLLIYMDVFSLLLEADGFPDEEIRKAYPKVLRTIIDLYPDCIFNNSDYTPFIGSHNDLTLQTVCMEK